MLDINLAEELEAELGMKMVDLLDKKMVLLKAENSVTLLADSMVVQMEIARADLTGNRLEVRLVL
jgi:hypothetical protein